MGIVVVAALAACAEPNPPVAAMTATRRLYEIGRQRRQAVHLVFAPTVFDRQVLPLDIAGFVEAAAERRQMQRGTRRRGPA